ncbi:hypothetical protein QVD17_28045 [Tagetes erecta]|uniref:Uncharacterized protein n=1 Tax=Tagetes erecta TaxID=13708 RepID=A0AAD8K9N2_TARER|nr:hypothetical protein QVD17_28045 [Tagetes erecta]
MDLELNIVVEEVPQIRASPLFTDLFPISFLKRIWTDYIRPATLGVVLPVSVPATPIVQLDEIPPEATNQTFSITNVCRIYFPLLEDEEDDVMINGSTVKFVIVTLLRFSIIKSQGENCWSVTIAVTSVLIYGFASAAQHLISHNSVYVFIARLGRKLCLFILDYGCVVFFFSGYCLSILSEFLKLISILFCHCSELWCGEIITTKTSKQPRQCAYSWLGLCSRMLVSGVIDFVQTLLPRPSNGHA